MLIGGGRLMHNNNIRTFSDKIGFICAQKLAQIQHALLMLRCCHFVTQNKKCVGFLGVFPTFLCHAPMQSFLI